MGRKKIQITRIVDERNRQVCDAFPICLLISHLMIMCGCFLLKELRIRAVYTHELLLLLLLLLWTYTVLCKSLELPLI